MLFGKSILPLLLAAPLSALAAQPLTLADALTRTLRESPELAVYDWELRAADARALQARLRPNPELSLMSDSFTGTGDYSRGADMEHTLEISQRVEFGGKRQARMAEARAAREAALLEYEARRLDALKATRLAFIDLLAAQQLVTIAEENLSIATKAQPTTERYVETGKAPAAEAVRAGIASATARIELEQARRTVDSLRGTLAARWGAKTPDFTTVSGSLEPSGKFPSLPELSEKISQNPRLAKWNAERARRAALLAQAKAEVTPDITFTLGPRLVGRGEDVTAVAGVSLPLPLWNRNQGNIAEARANLGRADAEEDAAQAESYAELNRAWQTLTRAHGEVEILRRDILPAAREAEALVAAGYEAGRFSQLDILEARRTLTAAQGQTVKALADYHKALAEIEALTAAFQETAPKKGTGDGKETTRNNVRN